MFVALGLGPVVRDALPLEGDAAAHTKIGLGALYDFDFTPDALSAVYGPSPHGAMAFVRLKLD